MTVGRIWTNEIDKGSGFALATPHSRATRVVLTAKHVVGNHEPSSLQFVTEDMRRIPVESVKQNNDLDIAVLHLSEDVADGLVVGCAVEGGSWQVKTQPRPNDPTLYGTITDTHRRFLKQDGNQEIYVLQLYEMQNLGDYKGYSGSPVVLKSPTDAVIGVLIEQLRSRLSVPTGQPRPATNVLYAIPIQDVLDRFDLSWKKENFVKPLPETLRSCVETVQRNVALAYNLLDPERNILPENIAEAFQSLENAKRDIKRLEMLLQANHPGYGRIIDQIRTATDQIDYHLIPFLDPSDSLNTNVQKKFKMLQDALTILDTLIPK